MQNPKNSKLVHYRRKYAVLKSANDWFGLSFQKDMFLDVVPVTQENNWCFG